VEPSLQGEKGAECETWVSFGGKQFCSPELEGSLGAIKGERYVSREGTFARSANRNRTDELPFDRILGDNQNSLPSILYTDITSPSFRKFHNTLSKTAKKGKTSYRIRHKPSSKESRSPLIVNGYGVELQLKRTDYIVIDDRQAEEAGKDSAPQTQNTELQNDDEEVSDLKPLSSSEVSNLAVNAASFVMKSEQPLDTLLKLVQDFPKHSSAISAHNATEEFVKEHESNRMLLLPSGYNVIWINGVQIPARDVNPFTLLQHLRRERKLINGVRRQGLSGPEAIGLLSHSAITESQVEDEPQRYDFRDTTEGGSVIVWLNNIEKDKRYEDWPSQVTAVMAISFFNIICADSDLASSTHLSWPTAVGSPRYTQRCCTRRSYFRRRYFLDCRHNAGHDQARSSHQMGYRAEDYHSWSRRAGEGRLLPA
jgi:UDP-glucose:glycoprotein glucosyltransferase